jgi:hypothetical protein
MGYQRENMVPVVHRLISNNVTTDIFGQKSIKLKPCSQCFEFKPYSDFYTKPKNQNLHRESIGEMHLRTICILCFDYNNKNVYNKGSRPKPVFTSTIDRFFCDEIEVAK